MANSQTRSQLAAGKTSGLTLVLILSALMAITGFLIDIYLPTMPVMAIDLQGDVELTIPAFVLPNRF